MQRLGECTIYPDKNKSKTYFCVTLFVYLLYCCFYIYRSSIVVGGVRYFSLLDDAMISMQYARNLADGYGLAWNMNGEFIEGFSNPAWVFLMSFFHLFPIDPSKISLPIQICGALFLILNLFAVKKISDILSEDNLWCALIAMILTAFYLPINRWGLQGMEVSVLTCIVTFSVWIVFLSLKRKKPSFWLYIVLGLSTFIRIDMAVFFMVICLFQTIADKENQKRHFICGVGILFFSIMIQTVFRYGYFGDLLPNTYYLKMVGYPVFLRISRGLFVFIEFICSSNIILIVLPFFILLKRRDPFVSLLIAVILFQFAYSIYVGGDAWEFKGGSNRFITIAMPVFFILFAYTFSTIQTFFTKYLREKKPLLSQLSQLLSLIIFIICLVSFNMPLGYESLREWLFIDPPFSVSEHKEYISKALLIKKITTREAKVAVVWAGIVPYFSTRFSIDLLGKNDRTIAKRKMRVPSGLVKYIGFYPGHLKWDYAYSIGRLRPDIVVETWLLSNNEADPYLKGIYKKVTLNGHILYLRRNSKNILWNKV